MQLDKSSMRIMLLKKRDTQAKTILNKMSIQICKKLLPFLNGRVAFYNPLKNEVDISTLFDRCDNYCLPRTINREDMDFFMINQDTKFTISKFGIMEPVKDKNAVDPNCIDVIIVPLIGFDRNGNRLGYGNGYYDRYLRNSTAIKIGVAYDFLEVAHLAQEKHDKKLDIIITNKEVIDIIKYQ